MEIREYKGALLVLLSIAFTVFMLLVVVTAYMLLELKWRKVIYYAGVKPE